MLELMYAGSETILQHADSKPLFRHTSDLWFSQDKFLHFSTSAALSGMTHYLCVKKLAQSKRAARVYSVSLTAFLGLAKEFYDKKKKGHFSWKDLCWDAAGVVTGFLLFIN